MEDDESFCPRIHEKDREKGYVAHTGELCVVFSDIATIKEKYCLFFISKRRCLVMSGLISNKNARFRQGRCFYNYSGGSK